MVKSHLEDVGTKVEHGLVGGGPEARRERARAARSPPRAPPTGQLLYWSNGMTVKSHSGQISPGGRQRGSRAWRGEVCAGPEARRE